VGPDDCLNGAFITNAHLGVLRETKDPVEQKNAHPMARKQGYGERKRESEVGLAVTPAPGPRRSKRESLKGRPVPPPLDMSFITRALRAKEVVCSVSGHDQEPATGDGENSNSVPDREVSERREEKVILRNSLCTKDF